MLEADPEFILGRALELEVELLGGLTSPRLDKAMAQQIEDLNKLAKGFGGTKPKANEHELLHVEVVNQWAASNHKGATRVLETIATLYPEDVSALKLNQETLFMLGESMQMRNSLAGSLRHMSEKNPLKGFVHGMFSFALEESNMYPASKREALIALDMNPNDSWAIHNYAHCLEMEAHYEEGLKWMLDRQVDWEPCQMLACHQFWHTALFHLNQNNLAEACDLLSSEVLKRFNNTAFGLHDGASMLMRWELVNLFDRVEPAKKVNDSGNKMELNAKRWDLVYEFCNEHKHDHLVGFNDAHIMMGLLGSNKIQEAREFLDSMDTVKSLHLGQEVVKPLCQALLEFKLANYERCVQLIEPIRFEIIHIGGSHAQRDIFEQLLLVAALKSSLEAHQKLAKRIVQEREIMHGGKRARLTELLLDQ